MVDHHFISPQGPWYRPLRRLERYIDRHAPHIVTSSTNAAAQLAEDFGCVPHCVTPIPDCVDTEMFRPFPEVERERIRRAWGIPEGRTVVVYLGKLAEVAQGTGHLLRAAQRVLAVRPEMHLVVGGYPYVDEYRAEAEALGIAAHCTFTGRIDYQHEAPGLLAMADVAVSPKMSETEGAGKILNYMAAGLPTVAFEGQVSREFLGSLGVYAPRGDVEALAGGIAGLVADDAHRRRLGEALRRRAEERFSWEQAGRALLGVYASLRVGRSTTDSTEERITRIKTG